MDKKGIAYFDSVYNQAVDSVEAHLKYGDDIQQKGRKSPKPKTQKRKKLATLSKRSGRGKKSRKN